MKPSSRFLNWAGSFGSWTTERPQRPAMPEKQPREYAVTIEIEGKRYTGFYTVSSGVVTVESDWGERISPAGLTPARTALLLFREILLTARDRSPLRP
jgi:hypothetical protein